MQELPFAQVRATSLQVLVGPYGALLVAFAQVTVGSCRSGFVARQYARPRWRRGQVGGRVGRRGAQYRRGSWRGCR